MKTSAILKVATFGLAFGMGVVNAASSSCATWCQSYSWQMQSSFCAEQRGGSACASSVPLNGYFYQQCVSNYCSN